MKKINTTLVVVIFMFSLGVEAQMHVDALGNVGIGTSAPDGPLHVSVPGNVKAFIQSSDNGAVQFRFRSNSGNRRFLAVDANDVPQTQLIFDTDNIALSGRFGNADRFATFDAVGLVVNGSIETTASGVVHADYVFENDFDLKSIDQHAEHMWQEKHLPAVGPGVHDENGSAIINVGLKTMGMLEELEIAHIYIQQLHKRLEGMESSQASIPEFSKMGTRVEQLELENQTLRDMQAQMLVLQKQQQQDYQGLKSMLVDLQIQAQSKSVIASLD